VAEAELAALRAEIDALDKTILTLLHERMAIIKRVGLWKAKTASGLCPIRSGREAKQINHVSSHSGDFLPAAAVNIWRHIINASLALEGRLAISVIQDTETLMHSREYFGNYTPHTTHTTAAQVVKDVVNGTTDVGVVPLQGDPWWSALQGTDIRVFAALPCVSNTTTLHALAFARLHPEPSGDDVTLAVFSDTVECAISHTTLDTHENKSLVAIEGFITQDALPNATVIGAYAKPLTLK
jgi:chorismate mutase / prephenate dehydratase